MAAKSIREAVHAFAFLQTEKMRESGFLTVGYYCRCCDSLRKNPRHLCECCLMLEHPDDVEAFVSSHWAPVGMPRIIPEAVAAYAT